MVASTVYKLQDWEDLGINFVNLILDNIKDLRIHSTMYPENATNVFKACLSGIRRQLY